VQYFAWGINKPGVKDERTALIKTHWDFIAQYDDELIARGPVMDEADLSKVIGSIHIADLPDQTAAEKFVYDEPFAKAGLFENIILERFQLELGRTQFEFKSMPDHPRFFIYCPAIASGQAPETALSDAHRVYVASYDPHLVCHGSLLNADGAWQGKIFFLEFPSRDDVDDFMAGDPYDNAGFYDQKDVFRWTMGGPQNLNAAGALK